MGNSQRNLEMSVESTWFPRVSNKLKSLNRNEKLNVLRTHRKCVYKNSFYPISGCYEFKKEKSDYIFKTSRDFILRRQSKKGEDIISEINRYTSKLDGKKNEKKYHIKPLTAVLNSILILMMMTVILIHIKMIKNFT